MEYLKCNQKTPFVRALDVILEGSEESSCCGGEVSGFFGPLKNDVKNCLLA
jgi:hypothetical protein